MFSLTVKEILDATRGKLISGDSRVDARGISTDTRSLKEGDLFVALKGDNFDGHRFVNEAIGKGAVGAVIGHQGIRTSGHQEKDKFVLIRVKDTLKAYGEIAHWHRMKFHIPFIGITGSAGKTTVKEMIYGVLSSRFRVLKNEGTENNLVGVPKTLLKLNTGHGISVVELGTNHFGEMKRLAAILKPDTGLVTNIGPSHLEFLKSKRGVFREKIALMHFLNKHGSAMLNADDEFLGGIRRIKSAQIITFGVKNKCDFRATKILRDNEGITFTVNGNYDFRLRLPGGHNVYNALAAIAAGFKYNISYENIYGALSEFQPQKGRLNLKKIGMVDVIDDTYNSNPQSLTAALSVLADYRARGRKIFVFGDMLELGRDAARFHTEAAGGAAAAGIDYLIAVGRFSEIVKEAAIRGGMKRDAVFAFRNNLSVLEMLREFVREGDVLLLKGSRLVKLDEVADALPSFISVKRDMVRI